MLAAPKPAISLRLNLQKRFPRTSPRLLACSHLSYNRVRSWIHASRILIAFRGAGGRIRPRCARSPRAAASTTMPVFLAEDSGDRGGGFAPASTPREAESSDDSTFFKQLDLIPSFLASFCKIFLRPAPLSPQLSAASSAVPRAIGPRPQPLPNYRMMSKPSAPPQKSKLREVPRLI